MYGFGRSFNTTNKPRYYEQHGRRRDYRNQPHGSTLNSKTAIPRPLITNSILALCFFHNPAFTFHHITRENIRPLHAGQTEHRRRPSLHDKQSGLSGRKTQGDRKRDSRPPLLFALALVWHSSTQVLHFKVTKYSETQ